jgi:hypothetical protein
MSARRGGFGKNDLFRIFPDLPGVRRRTAIGQLAQIERQVQQTRERAFANIRRQRAATERVRAAVAARRRD